MSFWKRLFGGGSSAESGAPVPGQTVEHEGFVIRPAPFKNEGQYQTAGTIEKEIAGVRKEHKFIRAERHSTLDEAVTFAVMKAKQIIDEQGERIFH